MLSVGHGLRGSDGVRRFKVVGEQVRGCPKRVEVSNAMLLTSESESLTKVRFRPFSPER